MRKGQKPQHRRKCVRSVVNTHMRPATYQPAPFPLPTCVKGRTVPRSERAVAAAMVDKPYVQLHKLASILRRIHGGEKLVFNKKLKTWSFMLSGGRFTRVKTAIVETLKSWFCIAWHKQSGGWALTLSGAAMLAAL